MNVGRNTPSPPTGEWEPEPTEGVVPGHERWALVCRVCGGKGEIVTPPLGMAEVVAVRRAFEQAHDACRRREKK